jgi:hypothetical protein
VENSEESGYGVIRDGIIVIPKGTTLPDGHDFSSFADCTD